MKFGIVPINLREFTNPEVLIPFVQKAEALGRRAAREGRT